MSTLSQRLARNLYRGYPDTTISRVPVQSREAELWHGLPRVDASEERRLHFTGQAERFIDGTTAEVTDPALLAAYARAQGDDEQRDLLRAEIDRRALTA